MAIESREVLKTYFETGDIPTEEQFGNLIDSFISRIDDGVYIFEVPGTDEKRFGVGIQDPAYPLGVQASGTFNGLVSLHDPTGIPVWLLNTLPDTAVDPGLNFEQQTPGGGVSRLFLNENTGNVGMGTLEPADKLQLQDSTPSGNTGIRLLNVASVGNQGWTVGHLQDAIAERDGALTFNGNTPDSSAEYMVIRTNGNVGINEPIPDTKLHVSRPTSDPSSIISLVEGTGIAVVGPITDNVAMDFEGVQARTGEYVGNVLNMEVATLNLQKLGGEILIHGDGTIPDADKMVITENAEVGLGIVSPQEKLDVDGAVRLGTTANDNAGTIRWTGSDFEGRTDTDWVSLTDGGSGGFWQSGGDGKIYYNLGTATKVGIGLDVPKSTLDVRDTATSTGAQVGGRIISQSTTTGTGKDDHRVALGVAATGTWAPDPAAKNIGIYVSDVSGQSTPESNLAAVLNGNVVVGDIQSGATSVGAGGQNVLAIREGAAPIKASGAPSVQLFAAHYAGTYPVLQIMDGNEDVLALYKEAPLTAPDDTAFPSAYDSTTTAILDNMRLRINELESRLEKFGLL